MELEKMETKVCSKCKKELPITHFWKQRKKSDGLYCYGNKSDTPVEDLEQYLNGGTTNESL